MMKHLNNIDDYLSGRLSDEERERFESELENDPKLKERLGVEQEIRDSILERDIAMLREKLRVAESAVKPIGRVVPKIAMFTAAAGILLILALRLIITSSIPLHEKLFNEYFTPYKVMGEIREVPTSSKDQFTEKLTDAYVQKEYHTAISFYLEEIESNYVDEQMVLMLASAYLAIDIAESAEQILLATDSMEINYMTKETVDWYLALTYLKQGNMVKAGILLQEIEKGKGYYRTAAAELLNSF